MSKVFVDVGVSLDGYLAGPDRGPANPMGGASGALHRWFWEERAFREHLGLPGGVEGPGGPIIRHTFDRIGANVMGRNMFDEGEAAWPEKAPFGCPVFVLTHRPREPWVRPGGTTFHFVTDGFDSALAKARAVAGGKDVRISGGAEVVCEALKAGVVEEMIIHVAPVILGEGLRLFDGVGPGEVGLEQVASSATPGVTHITYQPR
jgi:dihydrofolate reductase